MAFEAVELLRGSQPHIGCALLDPLDRSQLFWGDLWKGLQISGIKPEELTGEATIQRDRALMEQPHGLKARRTRP